MRGPGCTGTAELFPIPAPFEWSPVAEVGQSRRKRMRWRRKRFIELLVNLQVAALNFVNGRGGEWAFGIPLNHQQSNVVDNLVLRARSLSRLGRSDFLGCGSKVAAAATELDALQVLFSDSEDLPYGVSSFVSTKREDTAAAVVEPLVASKVAFPSTLQGFDPLPYLGETTKLAYHNPSSLLGWKEEVSTKMISPDAVSKETRRELHLLGRRWDDVDRLTLALLSEVDVRDRCNLFCIAKTDGELRQIIDRRPRNSRELPPPRDGAKMGHPSSFLGIVIPQGFDLVGSLDDLRNFYHEFVVSSDRALSTPVGPFWSLKQWQGTNAFKKLKERHPARALTGDTPVLMCFQGLSMGDHWAPTIAQESHEKLLCHFDALRPEEHIQFGQPFPRAPLGHVSGVCVDDKVNIQLVPSGQPDVFLRDAEACEAGDRAYSAAGLTFHPRKRVRRASTFTAWGAEFQGKEGLVGAKRSRLCSLAFATGLAAKSPALTRRVIEVLLGCWAFCFQFRRPLFSIIQDLYHVGSPDGKHDAPFSTPYTVKQELLLLSILGPTALAQLRCPVCPTVFGSDASPEGAGVVTCRVGSQVAQELFRRSDPRGFHTRVLPRIAAYLHEQGMPVPGHLVSNDFDVVENTDTPQAALFEESPPVDTQFVSATRCKTIWTQNREVLVEALRFWERASSPVELHGVSDDIGHREFPHSGSPSKVLGMKFDFLEISNGSSRMSKAFADKGPRDRADLQRGRVTGATATLRSRLLEEFQQWVLTQDNSWTDLRHLARSSPITMSEMLGEFGRMMYEQGSSRRNYAETINAVVQDFPFLRQVMNGPWQLATTWETIHPSALHPPIPQPLMLAMVAVALAWKWFRMSLLILIGFYALLRPAEIFLLKPEHFSHSSETGNAGVCIIRLLQTKSRTRGAKHQSVRLDEPFLIAFLEKCFRTMHKAEPIWPFSANLFRTRFAQLLFGVCQRNKLVLPSSLRPGGATFLFQLWNENIPKLQWRGRWLHLKTMLHYIQELGSINVLNALTSSQKARVFELARLCPACLQEVVVAPDIYSLKFSLLASLADPQDTPRAPPGPEVGKFLIVLIT
eukprot:s641_g22.t1